MLKNNTMKKRKKTIINPKPYSSHQPSFDGPSWFGPLNTVSKIYPIILTECFIGADSEIKLPSLVTSMARLCIKSPE